MSQFYIVQEIILMSDQSIKIIFCDSQTVDSRIL